MKTTVSKVDKGVLLSIPNPQYNDKIKMFPHPAGVTIDDEDMKPELPMHLILGASEYSRINNNNNNNLHLYSANLYMNIFGCALQYCYIKFMIKTQTKPEEWKSR